MPTLERHTEIVQLTRPQIEAAFAAVLPDASVTAHHLAGQGRANTNYIVDTSLGKYVLRMYVRAAETCAKERALHALVADRVPVPSISGSGGEQLLGHPFSVLDFVPGPTFEELALRGERAPLLNAARSLGGVLAELTHFQFAQRGDLRAGPTGSLKVRPWGFADFYQWCLFESPAGARLGPLRDRVWSLIERHQGSFAEPFPVHLAHGDFNPSNLICREDGRIASVLDWEFSNAGNLWQDLGNLLRERPEFELPSGFESALCEGFAERGVELPQDWRAHAEFEDLSSACDFLSSTEEKPETHARALGQISRLLARFGG